MATRYPQVVLERYRQKRLKWDRRFLELAKLVSTWSKDPSTQVGAVIVRPDHSIASIGFNGFPAGMPDDPELYTNREEKYSRIIHAEMNAALYALEVIQGYTLYTYPFACCDRCAVHMIQKGIQRFVYPAIPEDKKGRWEESLKKTTKYFEECNRDFTEI